MAVVAILNFTKSAILNPSDLRVVNIYLQTKFGANRSRSGRDTPVCVQEMAAVLHLRILIPSFGPSTMSFLAGCIFPASGIMTRSDVTEILRFYDFADLAGKCQFALLLGAVFET